MKRTIIVLLASFATASFCIPPKMGLKINCIKAKRDKAKKETKNKKIKDWPPMSL